MKPMRVKVEVWVELKDPQQWADTYGRATTPTEIRADVKAHIGHGIAQGAPFGSGEVDAEIDWK
jgi:hypothetical protein